MSAATQTKIFGMKVAVDRRVVVGVLAVIVALVFWYNLRGSDESPSTAAAVRPDATGIQAPVSTIRTRGRTVRRTSTSSQRAVLGIRPVDASDGRIDPTLRLDLLARLQSVEPMVTGRSLFEVGQSTLAATAAPKLTGPKIPINTPPVMPQTPVVTTPVTPVANIPLRFYGFVHPASKGESSRGLFMDGDNILVGKEGDLLEGRYLVVELSSNRARMEDTQLRQGQMLPVTPEATAQ